jgi:RNA polymerase sigma-70 factor (ECF subfamily)
MRQPPPAERHARLVAMFEAHHVAVLGYLARRSGTPEQAADAFSEVFLVAWRRLDDVPAAREGLGPSEAAEVLGLSPEAARSRLHRARARLRSLLDPTPEEVR